MENNAEYVVSIDFNFIKCRAWIAPVYKGDSIDYSGEAMYFYSPKGIVSKPQICNVIGLIEMQLLDYQFTGSLKMPKDVYPFLTNSSLLKVEYSKIIQELVDKLKTCNPVLNEHACEWCFYIPPFMNGTAQRRFVFFDIIGTAMSQKGISVNHFISPLRSIKGYLDNDSYLEKNSKILYVSYGADTIETYLWSNGSITSINVSNLGASMIEKLLFDDLKKNYPDYRYVYENNLRLLNEMGNTHLDLKEIILYELKKEKEECYIRKGSMILLDFQMGKYTGCVKPNNPYMSYRFEYFWDNIDDIIKPYQDEVSQYFQEVKDSCPNDIDRVYCVGKPFEMPWLFYSLKSSFDDCIITMARDSSFVPVRGTAYYVRDIIKKNV